MDYFVTCCKLAYSLASLRGSMLESANNVHGYFDLLKRC